MDDNYYSTCSPSNGAPVFAVPVQTTSQVPIPPPSYSMAAASNEDDCHCDCAFNRRNAIWLSVMLIISGVMGIIGTAMGLYTFAYLAEVGTGIWCGLTFIATGAVGIAAGQSTTIDLMKATVATSAFSIVFAVAELIIGTFGLFGLCSECYGYDWQVKEISSYSLLIASASFAFVFALWLLIIASICLRSMSETLASGVLAANYAVMTNPRMPQSQSVVIFTNYTHPTTAAGPLGAQQPPPQGVTPLQLPQVQPFVIAGQQPVFRQEDAAAVNAPSADHREPGRHGNAKGGDHGDSL